MRHHRIGNHALGVGLVDHRLFGNQDRHRGALRVIVLARDVEDVGTDDFRYIRQDLGQTVGVVLFIDVFDIAPTLIFRRGIAHVIDVEAE